MDLNPPNSPSDDETNEMQDQSELEGNLQPGIEVLPEEVQPSAETAGETGESFEPVVETPVSPEESIPPIQEEVPLPVEELVPPLVPEPKPESAFVKGFRRVVQWAIIGLLLLAVGGALAFFLTAQPARTELKTTQAKLQSLQETLTQSEADLAAAQSELAGAKDMLKTNETTIQASTNRIQFLRVISNINTARYAIVKKQGATARLALLDAQAELKPILDVISKADQPLATLLETRLQRAINNLSGDTAVAEADLNTLIQDMGQLEDLLFPD